MKFAIALLLISSLPAFGQMGRGTILGQVTDPSGAAVPGAMVVVTNVGTNIQFQTQTNAEGLYTTPPLNPGSYSVSAESSGFKKAVRSGVTLEVDQKATINFTLEVGAVADSVEVKGAALLVDTASATLGKVVENRGVTDLPLNGRNVFNLALLAPGIHNNSNPTGGGIGERGTGVANVSINGSPDGYNAFSIDGANGLNPVLNEANVNPAPDSIQEFKVQSVAMSAEYGFTLGGTVNVATKSGTNSVHGTAYEFLRNDVFDARNTFSKTKAPLRYNQYGFSLGGPVWLPKVYNGRNRTFFFVNHERYRQRTWGDNYATVPTVAMRAGDFSQLRDAKGTLIPIYDPATTMPNPNGSGYVRTQFPGNIIPSNRLDPATTKIMNLIAKPNATPTNAFQNTNNLFYRQGSGIDSNQTTARIDQRISDKNTLYVRYMEFAHYPMPYTGGIIPFEISGRLDLYKDRNAALSDTHVINATTVNDFRIGLARQRFTYAAPSLGEGWPQKLGLPAGFADVFPIMNVSGLPGIGQGSPGNIRAGLDWQFFDAVSKVWGRHTVKFGAEFRQNKGVSGAFVPANAGSWNFGGLTTNPQAATGTGSDIAQFLLGAVSSGSVVSYGETDVINHSISLFAQDDWRVSSRLTLNLGLRYDYQESPYESHNRVNNFDPFAPNPETGLRGAVVYGDQKPLPSLFGDKLDFSPRIGFAYDLTGNGKTAVRGAYSIFYGDIRPYTYQSTAYASNTTSYVPPISAYPLFQFSQGLPSPWIAPLGSKLGPSYNISNGQTWVQSGQHIPMSQQWSLSLQHQIRGWLLEAAYSANHGTHLESRAYDANQLNDVYYPQYKLQLQDQVPNPYKGMIPGNLGNATVARSQLLKPYPWLPSLSTGAPSLFMGNSIYHGLHVSAEKRMASGLSIITSYTFGKTISDSLYSTIDFSSEQGASDGFQTGLYDRRRERALDGGDIRHRFVASVLYELPFGQAKAIRSRFRAVNTVIGGWQVNTITTAQSGQPLVVRGSGTLNFRTNRPDSTGKSAYLEGHNADRWFDTSAFIAPQPWLLGNVPRTLPDVRRPGIINVDLSLIKDTPIYERMKLQFRAEAFNALNHVNLGAPNTSFTAGADGTNVNANFGRILSARSARNLQLALKLIF